MKFFSIVKTFNKNQWSEYLTYLKLYHKQDGVVYTLAKWLDSQAIWSASKEQDYKSELLISQLPYSIRPQTLSNALTKLGNEAEEYLGWIVWKKSSNLKTSCQLLGLAQKSLSDQYLSSQKEVFKESQKKIVSIWDEHYKMRALFNDYYFGISSSEHNYVNEFNSLISSFQKSTATIAQLLLVEIKNREKLLSESWTEHEEFFHILSRKNTALKNISDQLILMNHQDDQKAYEFLMQFLYSKEIESVSRHIQFSIVTYSINFLTRTIRKGNVNRGQELLDLYEYSLENDMFTLNEKMPLKRFINIINVASKLEKFDWSRKIVDKWAHRVDENNAKSIAKFGQATIDFQLKQYENVVETLSQMKSTNFDHRLRSRWLLLIAQYEINKEHIELRKAQLDNFRRFVVSNEYRINSFTYQGIKVSIKILNMLLNRKKRDQIENYYRTSKNVFERTWILQKIKNPM